MFTWTSTKLYSYGLLQSGVQHFWLGSHTQTRPLFTFLAYATGHLTIDGRLTLTFLQQLFNKKTVETVFQWLQNEMLSIGLHRNLQKPVWLNCGPTIIQRPLSFLSLVQLLNPNVPTGVFKVLGVNIEVLSFILFCSVFCNPVAIDTPVTHPLAPGLGLNRRNDQRTPCL